MKGIKGLLAAGIASIAMLVGAPSAAEDTALTRGLDWLQTQVQSNGAISSERESLAVVEQVRTEAAHTLAQGGRTTALPDLAPSELSDLSTELLARRFIGLGAIGRTEDASEVLSALMQRANGDGGFGGAVTQPSNPLDASLALLAMRAGGVFRTARAQAALGYLGGAASADGSYSLGRPPRLGIRPGNRTQQVRANGAEAVTTEYGIDPSSNRRASVAGAARQYCTGNTTLANGQTFVYSGRGRMVEVKLGAAVQARYAYNGLGERVCTALGGGAACPATGNDGNAYQRYAGHLVGEYNASGALLAEHVWLGDTPVAVLKPTATAAQFGGSLAGDVAAYFVQPDHLDTPRSIVNAANQELWRWDSAPFGDSAADGDPSGRGVFAYRLRFPGQQYDAVSNTNYNYFRDYSSDSGRYLQSDPIGLAGGLGLFTYVGSSPLEFMDSLGLCKKGACDNSPKTLCEWLTDRPDLLANARDLHRTQPQWQGIDPDKTPVFYRCKNDVDKIRAKPRESGGHHPHGLALGGPEGQKLTPTNETRSCKNKCHVRATSFQMRLIREIKCKLGS